MCGLIQIWLTGMFNYYATNVSTTDQQHGKSASTTNTEVLYALESTGPQCEGYFLHWDTTSEPYGVVLKVRPLLSIGKLVEHVTPYNRKLYIYFTVVEIFRIP